MNTARTIHRMGSIHHSASGADGGRGADFAIADAVAFDARGDAGRMGIPSLAFRRQSLIFRTARPTQHGHVVKTRLRVSLS